MKVCMITYSEYFHDARIKAYVRSIEQIGGKVDVFSLRKHANLYVEMIGNTRIFYISRKYQGNNRFIYLFSYLIYFVKVLLKVSYFSLMEKYAAVHVHNMPNSMIFAAIIPKLLGATIFLDVHDLMTANFMAKFNVREENLLVKCLIIEQKICAMFASHVFSADHMQKAYLENVCRIPPAKITVIMNLPHEEVFIRKPKETSGDKFRLVYHGTIAKRLGVDLIVKAISRIADEIPVHLTIYGSGDYLSEVERLAADICLKEKVWLSKIFFATEKVPDMLRDMDLGIIGNRRSLATDKYMLPVKLLEYVFLKIPVIAPRLEIIQNYFDEDMIKYYEPEDVDDLARCIVQLYKDPADRKALAANALRFYDIYSWKDQAQEYLNILRGCAKMSPHCMC